MVEGIRLRLGASVAACALAPFVWAAPASAQKEPSRADQAIAVPATTPAPADSPSASTAKVDEVIVTGSRIGRANLELSSPVGVVGREEIQLRSPSSIEQVLRDIPGTSAGIGQQVNNGNGGVATFNLRGLGSNRNLVLLNGRRIVPATLGNVTDLNIIPLALIERSDIFTGGASTAYGADAVAGVVNFVTRRNFSGLEAGLSSGITGRGDGHRLRADLTIGANFADDRGNVALGMSYTKVKPVRQGARDFSDVTIGSTCTATQVRSGACETLTRGPDQGSGTAVPSSLYYPLPLVGPNKDGAHIDPATGAFVPGYSNYNYAPLNFFQTPLDRWSIFGQARYKVADNIEAYTEAFFTRSTVSTNVAPTGTFTGQFQLPLNNQYLSPAARLQLCDYSIQNRSLPAGTNCAAAIAAGTRIPVIVARRFTETGPRNTEYLSNMFQVTGGLRGNITDTVKWELFGQYGESRRQNTSFNSALADRTQAAILGCPAGSYQGCVPINLFGPEGSITPDMIKSISTDTQSFINTKFTSAQAIVNGDFGLTSPWADAPVGFAAGVEYRRYEGHAYGDLPSSTPGQVLGAGGPATETKGAYDSKEAFAELVLPIIANRPMFHSFTIEAGARYAHYSTSGGNWTYKAGGSWSPVAPIKLRAMYTRAVRAPNLNELYNPVSTGLANLSVDPCEGARGTANATISALCLAQLAQSGAPASRLGTIAAPMANQVNTTTGGNPNLNPETADTWTAGLVLEPREFLPGFSATIDWYRIRVRDMVSSPTVSDVLNGCFGQADPNNANCKAILRNPLTGSLSGDAATTPGVIRLSSNLGFMESEGFDFTAAYRRTFGWARVGLTYNGNITRKNHFQATPLSFVRECVNFYSTSCDPVLPKYSHNMRLTLGWDNIDASLLWKHISGTRAEPRTTAGATPPAAGTVGSFNSTDPRNFIPTYRAIKPFDWFDLSTTFRVSDAFRITMLVENLLDKNPPLIGSSIGSTSYNTGNTLPSTYDPLGRRYTVSATVKF